jgi:DNA ligase-1
MKILKPMLACPFDPKKAQFPYLASPKIDGIRFCMVDGVALSRSFKPIRNIYIQEMLSRHLPNGVDGELTVGENFQDSTSGIMTIKGEPDFKAWLFDYLPEEIDHQIPYYDRMLMLSDKGLNLPFRSETLYGSSVETMEEVNEYERICLEAGYEGVMLRHPTGIYKFGRATVRENLLLKVKRFEDGEAILLRIDEKMINGNDPEINELGYQKRSTHLDGMIPAGTAGSLYVRDSDGREFSIGSGLNDELRALLWANKEDHIGRIVKYKFFSHGVKELPRHPVFLGFRDPDDL